MYTFNYLKRWITTKLTDGLKKRVFKFIFKRAFGRFVTELDVSQLEVELYNGVVQLKHPQLNIDGINKQIKDFPFYLDSGVIESIKATVPWSNILADNLKIEIDGLELNFVFKENTHANKEMLSSFLTESFIGDRGNPNVLASSMWLGDLKKGEVEEEFKGESKSDSLGEGEEVIARIIEKVVSSLIAKIRNATFRFEFKSTTKSNTRNVLLFHFPELGYEDKTPMPSGEQSWYPAYFVYELTIKQFILQLYQQKISEKRKEHLDPGHTILYGDNENKIKIKLVTGDSSENKESSMNVECKVHSIHTVISPFHVNMLLEILDCVQKAFTKTEQSNCSSRYDDKQELSSFIEDDTLPAKTLSPSEINQLYEKHGKNGKERSLSLTSQDSNMQMEVAESLFKDVECDDHEEDSFYSLSDEENKVEERKRSIHNYNNYTPEVAPPLNLQVKAHLKSTIINILYEDTHLSKMWSTFRKTDEHKRTNGPIIPSDHLCLKTSEMVLLFETNDDRNCFDIALGTLSVSEKLFDTSGIFNVTNDYFGSENKEKDTIHDRTILRFIPKKPDLIKSSLLESSSTFKQKSPHLAIHTEYLKRKSSLEMKARLDPIQIDLDLGLVERLMGLLEKCKPIENKSKKHKKEDSELEILEAIDVMDPQTSALTCEMKLEAIILNIIYPKIIDGKISKFEFEPNKLCLEINKIVLSTTTKSDAEDTIWGGDIQKVCLAIVNNKNERNTVLKAKAHSTKQKLSVTLSVKNSKTNSKTPSSSTTPLEDGRQTFYAAEGDLLGQSLHESITNYSNKFDEEEDSISSVDTDDKDDEGAVVEKPVEQEKDMFNMEYALDSTIKADKTLKLSKLGVSVTIPIVKMQVTKDDYILLMKLLTDLSTIISKSSTTTTVQEQSKSEKMKTSPLHMFDTSSTKQKIPDIGLKLSITEMTLLFKDLLGASGKKHTFNARFNDFVVFTMMYSSPVFTLDMDLRNERFSVNEILSTGSKNIIRRYDDLVRDYRKNKSALLLNLSLIQPEKPSLLTITAQAQTNGLLMNLHLEDNFLLCLQDFLDTGETMESIMRLYVLLQDTVIDYSPLKLPSRLLINLNQIKFSTHMVSNADLNAFKIELQDISVHLHNDFKHDIIDYLSKDLQKKSDGFGFQTDLKKLNFVEIFSMNSLDVNISLLGKDVEPTKKNPPMLVECSKGTVRIRTCSDSLKTLIDLFTYIGNGGDFENKSPQSGKQPAVMKKPENEFTVQMKTSKTSFNFDDIDMNAFSKKGKSEQPSINSTRVVNIEESINETKILDDQVTIHKDKFDSKEIIHNYFPLCQREEYSITRQLPDTHPVPTMEIVLNDEIEVIWGLYGGSDWGNKYKNPRDETKLVEICLTEVFLQADVFQETDQYAWRVKLSIRDMEIIDKIKQSKRHKLLSYLISMDTPREQGSRMVNIVVEGVRPDIMQPKQELRVDIELLPLRINIYQDTFEFLLQYFAPLDPPSEQLDQKSEEKKEEKKIEKVEETQDKNDIFFQYLNISDLMFKIDYEPSKVNISELKQGDYKQLINLMPLNGLELTLEGTTISGVCGIDKLVQGLTEAWLPSIQGTKMFRFLLAIMPIKSVYNVGSGFVDLFMMPINQYSRDGHILRGLRNGITSFISNLAIETVGLTANVSDGANYVFSSVGALLGAESKRSSSSAMPGNPTEGVQQAISSLSSGVSNALYAIIAIPSDYSPKSVVKAVPIAMISPLIGVTGALAKLLHGIRNWMDPNLKEEHDQLYK